MRYKIRPGGTGFQPVRKSTGYKPAPPILVVLFLITGFAAVSLAQIRLDIRSGIRPSLPPTTPTASSQGGIHISGGRTTSPMWTVTDSHGYRWDIAGDGSVADGSNDAYDGGLKLQVNGTAFPSQPTARLNADGKEIEIGWRYNNLNISRRIFVNTKAGYCRWIDIFENTTGNEITVSVRYYSNMGDSTSRTHTTSAGANMTAEDWGIVTAGTPSSSRPAIVHVFAARGAKFKPTFSFSQNSDSLYCNASISVPPNKAVALCLFEAQRRPYDQALKFLKDFDPAAEMRLVPAPLRKILLNMGGAEMLMLGGIELKRSEKSDLLVLRNGNEIHGRITNKEYLLRTDFGQLKIPAGAVIGLAGRSRVNNRVHLVMVGGQIIAGELTPGPVVIKLSDGTELKITPKGLSQATYRVSPEKPYKVTTSDALAVFRTGARLAFDAAEADLAFLTPHGVIKLSAGDLQFIEMDTPDGGLHRIIFSNGSTLAGLLTAERVRMKLKLAPAVLTEGDSTLKISRRQLKRFVFPAGPAQSKNLARLTFRNTDVILGRFADAKLTVRGKVGPVTVASSKIAKIEFNVAAPGQVKLTTRDGTALAGKLDGDYVKFKIEPGPVLKIFTGHIKSITGAARPKTTNETLKKPATPTTRTNRTPSAEVAKKEAEIKQLKLAMAHMSAERTKFEAMTKELHAVLAKGVNNPRVAAKVQKQLMMMEKMLAGTRQKEEKIAKQIAEAKASLKKIQSATPTTRMSTIPNTHRIISGGHRTRVRDDKTLKILVKPTIIIQREYDEEAFPQ